VRATKADPLPGLNIAAAMNTFGGDMQRYQELLHKFVTQHAGDCENAGRLFQAEDVLGARNLLHGLSGVANLLQATELARLASTAENALVDGNLQTLPLLFDAMEVAMRTLIQSIERLGALTPTA
jgi:HPt (histidine-containing phosphotransfer) domain-containing protein